MDKPVFRSNPEARIQERWIEFLRLRKWFVRPTHGNAYQSGFPDLYLFHDDHGHRWADVKNPKRYQYTPAQCREWPLWDNGRGVWVLMEVSEEEYSKLFLPPNYRDYWRPSYDQYLQPVTEIIKGLSQD